jgi:prefoldin subunit 5
VIAGYGQLVAERNALDARIDEYNANVERLNALGAKIDRLNKSIDSFEGIQ